MKSVADTGRIFFYAMLTKTSLTAETLASVLEQSTDCIKLIDPSGDILWVNANGLCSLEFDSLSEVEGTPWADLWPEPVREQIVNAYRRATQGETVRFGAPCPTAKGKSRWWEVSVSPVKNAEGAHAGFLAISRDNTKTEMDREALDILMTEMRHRLRNTYTIMCSLMNGFARGSAENETFAREMSERMIALAAAQSLFDNDETPRPLGALMNALVAPFDGPNCPVKLGAVPSITIGRATADAIALVLGELSVNSGKHGALAHGGTLMIDAGSVGETITINWTERSNAAVMATSRTGGQGLALIQRIVAARQGSFTTEWHDDGLTAKLSID